MQETSNSEIQKNAFSVPVQFAFGLSIENQNFTVIGPGNKVYAPRPGKTPFVTGEWDPTQWIEWIDASFLGEQPGG